MKQGYPTYGLERFNNMLYLTTTFKDDRDCKEYLIRQRWADGDYICPYCGRHHCFRRSDGLFRCTGCGKNFSVFVGTIFERTKLSLVKWFMAMYYVSSNKKGVASHQLAKDISTTQKTAWYILHKIRTLFVQDGTIELTNEVECDEAYIGGREKNKHESKRTEGTQGRSVKTKAPVFGMIERGGKVVAHKVENTQSDTLSPIIRRFVKAGSRIFTDEFGNLFCFVGLNKKRNIY